MSIREMQLVWVSTDHPFDDFGLVAKTTPSTEEFFDAAILIWKERPFLEFVMKGIELAGSIIDYSTSRDLITGFAIVVNVISIAPLDIKYVKNDTDAEIFISILKEDKEGKEYFLKSDLDKYPEITKLVAYYEKNGIIYASQGKYYIKGSVLNRAFIVKQ